MIKAVVFDCFGVLTSDGWLPFAQKYFGDSALLKQEAHDLNRQVDSGFLGYDSFVHQVSNMAKIDLVDAQQQIEGNIANQQLFDYITSLKKNYKIGMLSNAGANWLDKLFTPEQLDLFDATALSFELGLIKPDPRTYTAICERLGVEPNEAVFVDDIQRYVTGAQDIGMKGVWYKTNDQLKVELEALLKSS